MPQAILAGLITLVTLVGSLEAQQAHQRKGFWIGFGLGPAENLSKGLDGQRLWGGGGYVRLGGTTRPNLLLGGEAMGWTVDYRGATLSRTNVHFVALLYPAVRHGFYLKGGLGGAELTRRTTSGNTVTTTSKEGFGTGLGLGYEIPIGRNLYLVPATDVAFQFFSRENDPNLGQIPGSNTIVFFTLGLTWH
jgi:hypothetical protein